MGPVVSLSIFLLSLLRSGWFQERTWG